VSLSSVLHHRYIYSLNCMISNKMYSKDNINNTTYNYYSSFANNYSNVSNNMGMMDFNSNHKFVLKPTAVSAEYAPNVVNINAADSMLLVHRRKMQRRAANRRSAQLSRARKKVCLLVSMLAARASLHAAPVAPSSLTHLSLPIPTYLLYINNYRLTWRNLRSRTLDCSTW